MCCLFPKLENTVKRIPDRKRYRQNPLTIADKLLNRRLELHLLQKEVAQILYVTEDTITNWELGRYEPQVQHYPAIISFLGYFPFSIESDTLGGKLCEFRYKNGLSHKNMGKLLGVDASTIGSWERNKNSPQGKTRKNLLELFA